MNPSSRQVRLTTTIAPAVDVDPAPSTNVEPAEYPAAYPTDASDWPVLVFRVMPIDTTPTWLHPGTLEPLWRLDEQVLELFVERPASQVGYRPA